MKILSRLNLLRQFLSERRESERVLKERVAELQQKLDSKYETSACAVLQRIWDQCSEVGCYNDYNAAHALFSRHLPKAKLLDPELRGWQPMESAPKDGKEVLVKWADGTGQEYVALAWYDSYDEVQDYRGMTPDDEGWWTYISSVSQEKIEPQFYLPDLLN